MGLFSVLCCAADNSSSSSHNLQRQISTNNNKTYKSNSITDSKKLGKHKNNHPIEISNTPNRKSDSNSNPRTNTQGKVKSNNNNNNNTTTMINTAIVNEKSINKETATNSTNTPATSTSYSSSARTSDYNKNRPNDNEKKLIQQREGKTINIHHPYGKNPMEEKDYNFDDDKEKMADGEEEDDDGYDDVSDDPLQYNAILQNNIQNDGSNNNNNTPNDNTNLSNTNQNVDPNSTNDNNEYSNDNNDVDYDMLQPYDENEEFVDLTALQPDQYHAPGYTSLLAPKEPRFGNKKCLVLDLDETLVHSSFKYLRSADFVLPVDIDDQIHNVYVIKRPGVEEFLKRVGELYEVVVFTASVSRYGDPLLDILDKERSIHHRLFREACYNYEGNYIKNLSQIGRPLSEIIILDNSPASYIFHPQHAIPISSWFSDTHDNELLDIIPLLEDLSKNNVLDVGKVLDVSI